METFLAEHILKSQGLEYANNPAQRSRARKRTVTGERPHLFVTGGQYPHFVEEVEPLKFECDCFCFESGRVCVHIIAVLQSILPANAWPRQNLTPPHLTPAQQARRARRRHHFKQAARRQFVAQGGANAS